MFPSDGTLKNICYENAPKTAILFRISLQKSVKKPCCVKPVNQGARIPADSFNIM